MRLERYLIEKITKSELKDIEKYADKLFQILGINIKLTKHFQSQVNNKRNKEEIKPEEITRLFHQSYKRYGRKIKELGPDAQAVIQDMITDINMPFVLVWNSETQELDLYAKTIMRKKNFKTRNPTFVLDQLQYYERHLKTLTEEYDPDTLAKHKIRKMVQEIEYELQLMDKDAEIFKDKNIQKKIQNMLHKVWSQLQQFYKLLGRGKSSLRMRNIA